MGDDDAIRQNATGQTAMRLDFSRSLYSAEAVHEAAAAYADFGSITVEEGEAQVTVAITDPDPDVPDLADHFANHVLHTSVSRERRSQEIS